MAGGFNSPNILFLNTYDALDRRYMAEIVPKLVSKGYSKYVELYAGGFAMPVVVASQGFKPEDIYCYDISLYSNILGYTFSGKDLAELEVKRDGELIPLTSEDYCENAAVLLYEQALARLEKAEDIYYFKLLLIDMRKRRKEHIDYIRQRIRRMDDMLHGLHFERLYIWDAFEKEKDSENTFIISNPPTYKGAYEKFFDTGGRITWAGDSIEYEIWDGSIHCKQLIEKAEEAKPLLFLLQQANKGKAATSHPIFSRYLSLTQNVYYNSNRPEEVEEINGLKGETLKESVRLKSKYPIMPPDYAITRDSKISVFVEKTQVAEYYRRIWLHRINGKGVSFNLCVVVDGYLMGFIGLDFNPLVRSYQDTKDFFILSYAVPAPNNVMRMARLLVHIAKSKKIINRCLVASTYNQYTFYLVQANRICTVEYSPYHEVKGLRGLMKIESKKRISDSVNALTYYADLNEKDEKEILNDFITIEERYKSNGRK